MKGVICTKDYYNDNGILLIAKGTEISAEKLRQLERQFVIKKTEYPGSEPEIRTAIQDQKLKQSYGKVNVKTLNMACDQLIKVIFESKQKPWRMHIITLSCYIGWLYTHSIDVALISLMMAIESGYPDSLLMEIGLGAVLHDIGKLLIPKRILQKTIKRSADEEAILRQHCELGWCSVSGCSLSQASRDIILQHHERLNGSGYPNQLHAEQISEYAKIVMIADQFSGITAGENYREPEKALDMLRGQSAAYSKEHLDILNSILTGR